VAGALGVSRWFALRVRHGAPASPVDRGKPVVAAAGIARPERFFDGLARDGWQVAHHVAFPDHHWFTPDDVDRVSAMARSAGAAAVLVTEKDAVRLEGLPTGRVPWVAVPLEASVEPADQFGSWVLDTIAAARVPRQAGES
jgi:tetraacyldisaccharide 4'-kinase